MKGLIYQAMEFRLCPVKELGARECFELRNDMLRLMLWKGHFGDRLDGLGRPGLEARMEVRRRPQCAGER